MIKDYPVCFNEYSKCNSGCEEYNCRIYKEAEKVNFFVRILRKISCLGRVNGNTDK